VYIHFILEVLLLSAMVLVETCGDHKHQHIVYHGASRYCDFRISDLSCF
jgi:hypothetical protein